MSNPQSPRPIARQMRRPFSGRDYLEILGGVLCALLAGEVQAEVFSYADETGNYIVSKTKPTDSNTEYAVLTDDGEFIRLVKRPTPRLPVSHWRPWFIPKEPHPFDAVPQDVDRAREPDVKIEEIDKR